MREIELNDENIAEISRTKHSDKEFEYLVTSHQIEVRLNVAKNPHLPSKFARWMVGDIRQEIRAALASNSSVDFEILKPLLSEQPLAVIAGLAGNSKLPEMQLRDLALHRSYLVREAVAENPSAPSDLLNQLSKDEVWGVRRKVATNSNTSSETLERLAADSSYEVLNAVAENEASTNEILKKLMSIAGRSESEVKALKNMCLKNSSFSESEAMAIYKEAMKPVEDAEEDEALMHSSELRIAIAQRKNLSDSFVELLMKDPYYNVRGWLARNLSIKDVYLAQLALDSEQSVRSDVVKNPNASEMTRASAILLGVDQDE
jgi:hypothetical protein